MSWQPGEWSIPGRELGASLRLRDGGREGVYWFSERACQGDLGRSRIGGVVVG